MPESTAQAETIFLNALEIESSEVREAYIAAECRDDRQMLDEVRDLLTRAGRLGDFLEDDSAPAIDLPHELGPNLAAEVGSRIGPYSLREQIGEGGMGIVFVADQTDPVRRKVALKIIKPGMATKTVVARFAAERQALAMMDHPNVATVLDGGVTGDGHPFFVMELVQGLPITDYCDHQGLDIRGRLKLFQRVCEAVEHAHRKGIIHRDLKPSNVLVAEIDGRAVPKVIDFGIAKALGDKLVDATVYTHLSQFVGTPAYMSPEQAGMGVVDVDTRSDVYSLGVLLYELLAGDTPFDRSTLKQAGCDEMRRIIREDQPRLPSARVSTLGVEGADTAQQRSSDPRELYVRLRGELDCVVMKALEKDRNQRYDSAKSLASDIARYLNNEIVTARPPSTWYRIRKYAQRNQLLVASLTMIFAALTLGVMLAATGFLQARQQRDIAEQRLREAEEARTTAEKAFDLLWEIVGTEWGKQRETEMLTVAEAMDQLEPKLTTLLKDQPEAEIRVRKMFANRLHHVGRHKEAREHLLKALDLAKDCYAEAHAEMAEVYVDLANELQWIWTEEPRPWSDPVNVDDLARYARKVIEIYDTHNLGPDRTSSHARFCLALSLTLPKEREEAEKYLREALSIADQLQGTHLPAFARLDLGDFLSYGDAKDIKEANALYQEANDFLDQLPGDHRTLRAGTLACQSRCRRRHMELQSAVANAESAWNIYDQDEDLKYELTGHRFGVDLAELYLLAGQPMQAERVLERITTVCEQRKIIKSLAEIHFLRGWWKLREDKQAAAEGHFFDALELAEGAYPAQHAMPTYCRFYLAECLRRRGSIDEACRYYALVEQHTRPFIAFAKAPREALWLFAASTIYGRNDESGQSSLHEAILSAERAMVGADPWETPHLCLLKANAQHALGQIDDAIQTLKEGLDIPVQPTIHDTRKGIPNSHLELKRTLEEVQSHK